MKTSRLRQRISTILDMVLAFIVMILLAQLWLFTVVLETLEVEGASKTISVAAIACSFVGCIAAWVLIRYFTQIEKNTL
jgi:hypothetical protein